MIVRNPVAACFFNNRQHAMWLAVLGLVLLAIQGAAAQAAKPFPVSQFSYYISDYEYELGKLSKTVTKTEAEIEADIATAEEAGNSRLAAAAMEQLLTRRPTDPSLWLRLGQALSGATPINDQDGYIIPSRMIGAGLRAYVLAADRQGEASALAITATGFAKREYWRPALMAYKESLKLIEDDSLRETYEAMRIDHGFRVVDYKVESDAAPPRVCFEMSEAVSRTVSDFTPYFRQEPGPASAVSAEGNQLCVEGLKHGERYSITARQGLPAAIDETLPKDFTYEFYVKDRSPSVRFAGRSYVLPRTGQNGIPLISVNSNKAELSLYRIGDRNLIGNVLGSDFREQINGYGAEGIGDRNGQLVWQGEMDTPALVNEDITTAFPVDEALGKLEPGLYVMTAQPAGREVESWDTVATQWFVVSDLGLSTASGKDGLHVNVRSIATAAPIGNVEVRLLARNNEVLATATTGADGSVSFAPGLQNGEGGQAPALVVAQSAENDYSFVDLTQPAFDLTDRGVAGRAPAGAVDAFVYAERGVYRRGETVHATVLLRDDQANALTDTPVTLVVERPDGVEYSRTALTQDGAGGSTLDIAINAVAQGGTWQLKAYTDPNGEPVGESSFLVEDYIPDRIEFDLTAKSPRATVGEGVAFAIDGRYLFGAPGAGLDLEANLTLAADANPYPGWKGYRFGLMDESVDAVQIVAEDLPPTDINGHANISMRLPDLPVTTRPLKADVAVRLREPGGRAVEQTASLPVMATQPLLGIKPGFDYGAAPEGQPAEFDVIAIDPDGKAIAIKDADWTLKRLTRSYQWFNSDGDWRYEAITRSTKIATGKLTIGADAPARLAQTLSWGEYRLEFAADGVTPVSMDFSAGYYYGSSAKSDTPDTLKVALDKTDVATGDTVNVKIEARYAGKANIRIMGDRQLAVYDIDVPEGGTTIPVTVGENWGTGAYVLATLFKPMDTRAKRMPARAVGVAWFGIDRAARTIGVTLSTPAMMKPRQRLTVPVKLEGAAAGEEAFITVAAVDVGILNLTRYNPPAPENFYYDQKRLSAELRDIYGVLIDGMQGERGRIRSGGDGGAANNAPPPTQPPLSLFSGIVKVSADGTATVDFDIPAFNGTVRVMAVAWSNTKVGHASSDVIVRDPLVIAGTLPRFLSVGDTSRIRFDLINAEAPTGDYTLGISINGPLATDESNRIQKLQVGGAGNRTTVTIPVNATAPGIATVVATIKGPGDIILDQTYTLGVMPANPLVTRRTTMQLAANGGALTLSKDLFAEMLPGTVSASLSVNPLPELDAASLVHDLDRYPYGCSEQTVSRAMPLLYLSDLGIDPKIFDEGLEARMQAAVSRLVNRQSGNGAFGLWSAYGDDSNLWLSAYVTDFLLRAREKGFEIPEDVLVSGIDYLRNQVGNAPDIQSGAGQDTAYALYVLARAGRAPAGDLKYLADTRMNDFGSPLARAQIGAALAMLGDIQRADAAFTSAVAALADDVDSSSRGYRSDYGSVLRDASAILALATDSKAKPNIIKTAVSAIEVERARSRYASTQDMSWMVLAARAISKDAEKIRLDADGSEHRGALNRVFTASALEKDFRVSNQGAAPLRAVVAVTGSPLVAEPEAQNGLKVTRSYYTSTGEPADIATVAQNTRLVVVLGVSTPDGSQQSGNFLLVDPLPAGFEIENPALISSGSAAGLPWLSDMTWASYSEFRDDRFVASFTNSTATLAYMVRAVAPGTYAHPGAHVEDMYRPEVNARTATGTVMVTER
ncbi:MAG: alpha-2-macroglobulin family protein [Alphaproteobacteria bacterium]|nr:alpha-2-macroglobulin family protein [Alphaproteobacteria bacterium]